MQNEPIEEYAPTAYHSDRIPEQEAAPEGIDKGFSVKARLPWGSYLRINPSSREFDEHWFLIYKRTDESEFRKYSSITHRWWSSSTDNKGRGGCSSLGTLLALVTGD